MDEFIVSVVKDTSTLIATVQLFILNLTLVQSSLAAGVFLFVVGVWFFSDGFDNWRNATAFVFSYAGLCFLILMAYLIITNPVFPTPAIPLPE